ncbi:MAG TPA: alpha/beta fold hydrolase [Acidimicrobiales bacterium]|nr:alpha/beta fold hydrolase [Acidimicrobiales bacterium]
MSVASTLTVSAPNGRMLSVRTAGSEGPAILIQHGTPGSSGLWPAWVDDAAARGARLVSYDRPGYGSSTPLGGRTVADCVEDARAACGALGIDRLVTWGISGGGPHALACAALAPDLFAAAASVSSPAPFDADGLDWFEGMGEENVADYGSMRDDPEGQRDKYRLYREVALASSDDEMRAGLGGLLSPADSAVMSSEYGSFVLDCMRSGQVSSELGWFDDDRAFVNPWGCDLSAIAVPVKVWHGGDDRFVPGPHGEYLARIIPGAEAELSPADGHLTVVSGRIGDVHDWLLNRL